MAIPELNTAPTYQDWSNGRMYVADPVRQIAMTMVRLANEEAKVLETMKDVTVTLSSRMAGINELMKLINKAQQHADGKKDDEAITVFYGVTDKAAVESLRKQFLAEGVAPDTLVLDATTEADGVERYRLKIVKSKLQSVLDQLRLNVDTVSTDSQAANLSLQNMLGKYNGAFEAVTSAIKNSGSQAESVNANIKR